MSSVIHWQEAQERNSVHQEEAGEISKKGTSILRVEFPEMRKGGTGDLRSGAQGEETG